MVARTNGCVAAQKSRADIRNSKTKDDKPDHENSSNQHSACNSASVDNPEAYCFNYFDGAAAGHSSGGVATSRTQRASKPEPCPTCDYGGGFWSVQCSTDSDRRSRKHLQSG